jgi:2-haloacid dehalogenase
VADPDWLASRPVVIFDLGGVIFDWDPRHLYRKVIADDERMEWFLSEVCSFEWHAQLDRGRPFAEAIAERVAAYPEYREWITLYQDRWPETLRGLIPGMADLVAELARAGRELFAITNWSGETFPLAYESYPVLHQFKDIVVSGDVGMVKPDPRIFALALGRFGVSPGDCLFIDDNATNVAAAESAGIAAVQFTSPAALRRVFASRLPIGFHHA